MQSYLLLGVAIVFELLGTSFMKMSDGYSRLYPTVGVFICYGIAFFGLVATAIIAVNVFGETMNVYNIIGIILILAGVLVLNLLGNTGH